MPDDKVCEKELVARFREAKERRDHHKKQLEESQQSYEEAESRLIEYLESNSATATATYEGIGYAQLQKPRLYASCRQEDTHKLFDYLKEKDRADLIKTGVAPQSLSGFVSECVEGGETVPEFISYYLKPSLRLYK